MKRFLYSSIFFSMTILTCNAYAISDKAGTSSGEFLRLPAGAKPAAMGEAFSALADDAHALYFNIAGLAKVQQQQALLAHTQYYLDVSHEYLAYVRPFKGGGIGASVTYLATTFEKRAGDTDAADSNGNAGDMAVSVGYGRELAWGINAGLAVKYISSTLDSHTANTAAIDIGLQRQVNDKITVGLAATNLGGSLKYISDAVALENTLDLGIAEKGYLLKNLTVALDYKTLVTMSGQSVNAGLAYLWSINPDWALEPRAGYMSGNATLTAGLGITYKAYQFDYAFNTQTDLGLSNRISLGMKF